MRTKTDIAEIKKVEEVVRLPNELPNEWQRTGLADVADIIMGQSPSSIYYNTEGKGLPFFQGKAEFGNFYPEAVKWCTKPSKIAQKDDVLISVRAPVGPTNLASSECCIGRGLAAIRPKNGIPSKYVLYYLRSIQSDIDALGTGTTFRAISGNVLRSIPIPVAPPEQQKLIVAEIEKQFSRLDEAVAGLKRVKVNLKRYKSAVFKEAAVEGKLTELWRKEHPDVEPASELLKRILDERRAKWKGKGKYKEPDVPDISDLPPLPQGWMWATVQQLAEIRLGKMLDRQKHRSGEELPYLRNINVRWDSIDTGDLLTMFFKDSELDRYGLKRGDVLVCEGGEPGRASVWDGRVPGMKYQKALHRVRFFIGYEGKLLVFLLEFLAKSGRLERWFTGSTIKHFTGESIAVLPVPMPPHAEQMQIVAEVERRLSLMNELEARVNVNIMRAERLRQAILMGAFSGHLVNDQVILSKGEKYAS